MRDESLTSKKEPTRKELLQEIERAMALYNLVITKQYSDRIQKLDSYIIFLIKKFFSLYRREKGANLSQKPLLSYSNKNNNPITKSSQQTKILKLFKSSSLRRSIYDTLPAISKAKRDRVFELSDGQFRLAYLEQMNNEFSSYNWLISFMIDGELNIPALEKSIAFLIARHESLRTGIDVIQKKQLIAEKVSWKLELEKVEDLANKDTIKNICESYAKNKFDLTAPPLLRSKITKFGSTHPQYLWLCVIHHSVFDGFSQALFLNELSQCYTYYSATRTVHNFNLPPLPIQFADYSEWSNKNLKPLKQPQLQYWQEQLKHCSSLELPTDFHRPQAKNFIGDRVLFSLSNNEIMPLLELCKAYNISLYAVLMAAFQCFLYRHTEMREEEDICTGTITANRKKGSKIKKQLENVIGFLANTIVIRSTLTPTTTLEDLIQDVSKNIENSIYHGSDISFGEVVNAINPPFDASRNPLFDTLFVFQDRYYQDLFLNKCQTSAIEYGWRTSRFDLVLELREASEGLTGFFEYDSDLYQEGSILRMVENFKQLLRHFSLKTVNHKLIELPLLSGQEARLINSFNKTPQYNQESTIHDFFDKVAATNLQKTALVVENHSLTYQELNTAANKIANSLIQNNIQPQMAIAICMERSLEAEIALLAVLKTGCGVMFLESDSNELTTIIKKVATIKPQAIIVDQGTAGYFTTEPTITYETLDKGKILEKPHPKSKPDDLALIALTSGTTGEPKGVMVAHRGWVNWIQYFLAHGKKFNIDADSRIFEGAPYIFDASLWERLLAYGLGGTLHVNSSREYRDPVALKKLFKRHQITIATFTPSFLARLKPEDFTSLKCVFVVGEALPKELLLRWKQTISDLVFVNGYGPTESTAGVTVHACKEDESISIGTPIDNMTIYILDNQLQPVPIGVYGELYIGGVGVAMGYYNDPEKTKQAFINNPFSKSSTDKLYKTGDKGRFLPDGKIEIAGRISSSNLVKLHGVRIELEEIETLLMQHPQIQQAFVHLWDNEHLTGYLLMKDESKLEYLELRNFLKEKGLTTIKIPSDFITITDIPLTKNGKLNKNFLPRPLLTEDIITSLYESPLTKTELTLRAMWKKIFGSKQIDREDSFRDIGGNSFWIISLLAKINKVFFKERGQRLTLSQLPPDFSIKSLGELIDGLLANQMSATSPSMQSIYDEFYNSF